MPLIKFVKEKKEVEVPAGSNLRKVAMQSGINVYQGPFSNGVGASVNKFANCMGFGTCGTCRVRILKGMENTNAPGLIEKAKFTVPGPDPIPPMAFIGNEDTMRLACKTTVNGDIEVETGPDFNLFGENFFS